MMEVANLNQGLIDVLVYAKYEIDLGRKMELRANQPVLAIDISRSAVWE